MKKVMKRMDKLIDMADRFLDRFLPEKAMRIVRGFLNRQFITFVLVGVVNTLSTTVISLFLDWAADTVFSGNVPEMIENLRITFVTGYILSLVLSFFLNCRFTFRQKPDIKKFLKFPISYIPNFIIQYIIVWIFGAVGFPLWTAYICAAVIGIPVTFLAMKVLVFVKKT